MSINRATLRPAAFHDYRIMHAGSARMVLEACQTLRKDLNAVRASGRLPNREQLQQLQFYRARICEAIRRSDFASRFFLIHGQPLEKPDKVARLQRETWPAVANRPLQAPWEQGGE